MDTSSLGRAQRSTKTINVEANLLSERLTERARIAESSRNRLIGLGLSLALFLLAAPPLYRYQGAATRAAHNAQAKADQSAEQRAALEKKVEEAQPKLEESELMDRLQKQSNGVVDQLVGVLNAVPAGVALSGVKVDVMGGTLTFQCTAEAESFEQAQAFLANARSAPGSKDAFLSSARQSAQIAPTGVGFDLIKKVEWAP
ncbi:MAG: hypothetical protein M9921_06750 [Fimbriimonadaceae bacterium]|nr:hypothetical protein [Chthonomonadaceae bacterium]MCO5296536.1 hypothetical protein [Fimbriimonadaceae bacterium]